MINKNKVKVSVWKEIVDKDRYKNEPDSYYKVLHRKTGNDLNNITVKYSELDTKVLPHALKEDLIQLIEDGYGFDVLSRGERLARLDYCEALELMLALEKHYMDRKTGTFVRVRGKTM